MEPTTTTLRRHANLIANGHEAYAIDHHCADLLAELAEDELDVQTEVVERNGAIIVRAVNHHLLD